ncbi:hypothetical protein H1C71_015672, partial [Ictidomys tridecemlineatus]
RAHPCNWLGASPEEAPERKRRPAQGHSQLTRKPSWEHILRRASMMRQGPASRKEVGATPKDTPQLCPARTSSLSHTGLPDPGTAWGVDARDTEKSVTLKEPCSSWRSTTFRSD